MALISIDNNKAHELYRTLCRSFFGEERLKEAIVVVQHMVPNTLPFLQALEQHFEQVVVVPKPNSINAYVLDQFENKLESRIHPVHARRINTSQAIFFKQEIAPKLGNLPFSIIDIGGYFADSFHQISTLPDTKLIGVVEDTENGHQKYHESLQILNTHERTIPVASVARSPLKEPEDFLVGQSIAYSVERILRDNNNLLTNKKVLVIGYGKIGKSIAGSLASKNVAVWVYDKDPIRRAQALSHGFVTPDREVALRSVEVVIGATGNHSLAFLKDANACDFAKLKDNCFVASVTSSDDEFSFGTMLVDYPPLQNNNGLTTYRRNNSSVHLLNGGNAVNFSHNNALGPYIYMVACELLACVSTLRNIRSKEEGAVDYGQIIELSKEQRTHIADNWMNVFSDIEGHRK